MLPYDGSKQACNMMTSSTQYGTHGANGSDTAGYRGAAVLLSRQS